MVNCKESICVSEGILDMESSWMCNLTVLQRACRYGTKERGARVIQFNADSGQVKTWIRFEDGRVEDRGTRHDPTHSGQTHC